MRKFKFNLKKLKMAAGVLLSFCVQQAVAQNPVLSMPSKYLELAGPGIWPLPIGDYLGGTAVYGHNAMPDANGKVAFFMVDEYIYDKSGTYLAWLNLSSGPPMAPSPEIAMVPKPGSCTKYYVFYGRGYGGLGTTEPYYSEVDVTASSAAISSTNMASMIPSGSSWARSTVAFAVSKEKSDGSRFLFVYNGLNSVSRFKLTASGITYDGYTYTVPGTALTGPQHAEFELYEKPDGSYKFALASKTSTISAGMVHTATLASTGTVSAASSYVYPAATSSEQVSVAGLEYSPDGNYLYITHTTSASNTEPFQYLNVNTNAIASLAVTGKADFQNSYIELGKNGKLYLAAANRLATLANPNSPNTSNWTNNALSVASTPIAHAGSSMPSVYVLPDQVDGMDYATTFFQHSVFASADQTICAGNCATISFFNATSVKLYPGGSTVTSPFTVCPGSTTTYSLTNASGSVCQKTATVEIAVAPLPSFAGTYSMNIPSPTTGCTPPVTGSSKSLCLSPTGMGTPPSSPISSTFRCEIANSLGWQGATTVGIRDLTFNYTYTVTVYEVDNTGTRLPGAPDVFAAIGTGAQSFLFNSFGYSAGFDAGYPYYVKPSAPANENGDGVGKNYFIDYYAYASSAGTLPALSAKIWCVDMKQQANPYCFVARKSYFKIANNGLSTGGNFRMAAGDENAEAEESRMEWEVYPNPSSNVFNVLLGSAAGNERIDVYDYTGKLVHTAQLSGLSQRIDLSGYAKGVYFIKLTGDAISETKKVVLE